MQDEASDDDDDDEEGEFEMEEGEAEMMDGEGGESQLSESSEESVAFDQMLKPRAKKGMEESDDEETQRKQELIRKWEGDENASDVEIDAALDRVIENKTEESKKHENR